MISGDRKKRNAYSLAWYHENKHKRGVQSRGVSFRTPEEKRRHAQDMENLRYRKKREAMGLKVKKSRDLRLVSKEQLHKEMLDRCKKYRESNVEKKRKSAREWGRRNRAAGMARFVERYHEDPRFNLAIKLRRRVHMALRSKYKNGKKLDSMINLLGCSYAEFKSYIESLFTEGMGWADVFSGRIHIDHIRPCKSYDLTDPEQQKACFHYTNLQPLWGEDNMAKGAKYAPSVD